MRGEVINELVDLLRAGMRLDDDHCVAYNQMIPIPPDRGIFVAVGILDSKPWAGSLSYRDASTAEEPALDEIQTNNYRDVVSIHIMSQNNDARNRRDEVVFSLTGTRAAQRQEANGFLIGKLPVGFVDSSITEGAERLNRFTVTFAVLYAKARRGAVEFFDSFAGSPALLTED
jgi:hypothetical protein